MNDIVNAIIVVLTISPLLVIMWLSIYKLYKLLKKDEW